MRFPFTILGSRYESDHEEVVSERAGKSISMPQLDDGLVSLILDQDRDLLVDVPLAEITSFLHRVGRNWQSDEYVRRRLFVSQLQATLGYSEGAAVAEADWVAAILCSHARMNDSVEVELGSRFCLDEWERSEEAFVRAYPLGLVAHVLPSNAPSSSLLSILRAILTKNVSVVKVASSEPATALAVVLSFLDVDPDHVVSKSVSVVYWNENDPLGDRILASADAVCAWGGAKAISAVRSKTADTASFVPFGPRWSFGIIGDGADLNEAALGVAHDVALYEQAACFSVVRVFVLDYLATEFVEELAGALRRYEEILPPRNLSVDDMAATSTGRLTHVWHGGSVKEVAPGSAIVVADPGDRSPDTRNRTVVVHPVTDLSAAYDYASRDVQTVGGSPWSVLETHRDALARRGVSRMVELGLSNFFRVGGSHDGMRPMQRLVRFVALEAPMSERPKGMALQLDPTTFLEQRQYQSITL